MFDRSMCPPERHQPAAGAPAAEDDELAGVTEDGLAQFALGEVERQLPILHMAAAQHVR